ncbi:MAG: type II secretion system F family protein [Candidatus Woesearchaeota archaeon]
MKHRKKGKKRIKPDEKRHKKIGEKLFMRKSKEEAPAGSAEIQKEKNKNTLSEKKRIRLFRQKKEPYLASRLPKSGLGIEEHTLKKIILKTAAYSCAVFTAIAALFSVLTNSGLTSLLIIALLIWAILFGIIYSLAWLAAYILIEVKIYRRTREIESVLPDFLQLAAANMNAGMNIENALWSSVKPKFGILSKEIENVAKKTISGESIEDSLAEFASRYDSEILKQTVSLLAEGIRAGGKIAALLEKIAANIHETRLLKKEMAANVATYTMFITFAVLIASPFLFALSTQLLSIVKTLMSGMDFSSASSFINIMPNAGGISIAAFKTFSIIVMLVSGFFSGAIVSVIKNGSVKGGVKTIAVHMIIAVCVYLIANSLLGALLGLFL